MALTIEELLINLGIDVSQFKSGLEVASRQLGQLAVAGDTVTQSFQGIENASANIGKNLDFSELTKAASLAAGAAARGVDSSSINFGELGKATALAAAETNKLAAAGFNVSGSLQQSAEAAKATDAAMRSLNQGAARVTTSLVQMGASGTASAASLVIVGRGMIDLAAGARELAASSPAAATGLAGVAASATLIAGAIAAPLAAFAIFETKLGELGAAVERENARTAAFLKDSVRNAEDTAAKLRGTKFELTISGAGFNETEKSLLRFKRALQDTQNETKITDAQIDRLVENEKKRLDDVNFDKAKSESQAAGKALTDNFHAAVDNSIKEFQKLEEGIIGPTEEMRAKFRILGEALQIRPADETVQGFRDLAKSLDFKGPLAEIQTLQQALDANAAHVREVGEANHKTEEDIRAEIKKTTELIKGRFKEDQKIKVSVDASAAKAEVDKFLLTIGGLPPTVLKTDMDISQAVRELDVLKAKIADTPAGELKIALKAEASKLEGEIAAARAREEAKPIDVTVNADTTAAEAALKRLREEAAKPLGFGGGDQTFFKEIGNAASGGEIKNAADQFSAAVAEALKSANVAAALDLRNQGQAFIDEFAGSIAKLGDLGTGASSAAALREIRDAVGALKFINLGTAGTSPDLSGSLQEFFSKQSEQSQQQIAATQQQTTAVTGSINNLASAISTGRIALGIRTATLSVGR
jgi:hypothetical protein